MILHRALATAAGAPGVCSPSDFPPCQHRAHAALLLLLLLLLVVVVVVVVVVEVVVAVVVISLSVSLSLSLSLLLLLLVQHSDALVNRYVSTAPEIQM